MTHFRPTLVPRFSFSGLVAGPTASRGVIVTARDDLGLASMLAAKGQAAALAQCMRQRLHIDLPQRPRRTIAGDFALICTAPDTWLAMQAGARNDLAAELRQLVGKLASISDQSDGYAVLRLSGPNIRDTLAKMIPVDLHHRAFAPGDVAATAAGHIGATLWRLADDASGRPVFEIAVFRSMAEHFWHFLCDSAAEFGLGHAVPTLPMSLELR